MLGHILLLARLLTLTLIGAFASVAGHLGLLSFRDFQPWWFATITVAALFSWLQFVTPKRWAAIVPVSEAVAAFFVVVLAGDIAWPLVIYLIMTPVFVGIAAGGLLPVLVAGAQLGALLLVWTMTDDGSGGLPGDVLLRLNLVGLLFGSATALVRHVAERTILRRGSYARALELLEQLSDVTRQLPSGLSLDAVASQTIESIQRSLGAAEVALFIPQGGMWTLQSGPAAAALLCESPDLGDGMRVGLHPLRALRPLEGHPWTNPELVRALPLRASGAVRGVAVARYETRPGHRPGGEQLRELADELAAQLAAAEVYAEVRERATAEERRRVSREIHDGVAQDLAALTYRLDNIAADSGLAPVGEAAEEVRRLVRELRLSIFDLRTDLGSSEALGKAIGDYAQQVAASTGIVVHTTVSEHGTPLEPHTQHELLRVCQEAVANARRHSRARNMWITYKNHGSGWLLRVADDGIGVVGKDGSRALSGEGLSIMRERVTRIGGTLAVRRRIGGGTVIEVTVNRSVGAAPSGTASPLEGNAALAAHV